MTTSSPGDAPVSDATEKLVTWKAIADFFECDVRTAKRWEHERGLPVHRAPGGKRGYVFGYTNELDEWLRTTGRGSLELESGAAPFRPMPTEIVQESQKAEPANPKQASQQSQSHLHMLPKRWLFLAATGAVISVAGFAALRVVDSRSTRSAQAPAPAVLVAVRQHVPIPEAEKLYLSGRYYWNLRTADGLSKAVEAYTQAIVIDPSFAEPYAGLAETYELMPQFASADLGEALAKAEKSADKAIQLNPNLISAHRAEAFALFFRDWDIARSDAEFQRAIRLDPLSAQTHQWYASTLFDRLEGPACIKEIEEALRLDPASPAIAADAAFFKASFGDLDAGVKTLREIERTQPGLAVPSQLLSRIDFGLGNFPGYVEDLRRTAAITHSTDDEALAEAASKGWIKSGRIGLLEAQASVMKRGFERGTERGFGLGETLMVLGRRQEALTYFRASALDRHDIGVAIMKENPQITSLSSDPGYRELFAEIDRRFYGGHLPHPAVMPLPYRLPQYSRR